MNKMIRDKFKIYVQFFREKIIFIIYVYLAAQIFLSGLLLNVVQAVLSIVLNPFSKSLFRRINKYICASIYSQALFIPQWITSMQLHIYVNPKEFKKYYGKEHSFCIINHTYELDWLIHCTFCDKIGCLGNIKSFLKREFKWLPMFGWCWYFSDFIFLERSFEADQILFNKQLPALMDHPEPIWLAFYPEGTRYTTEKYEISKNFAKSKGLPQYKYHLTPRTKGFLTCLPFMEGKMGGLYDIVLSFQGGKDYRPNDSNIFRGEEIICHLYIQRIPFEEVPQKRDEAKKFLFDLFEKKDRLQDSFHKTGDFFAESGVKRLPSFKLTRSLTSLFNFLLWSFILSLPLLSYWIQLFLSANYTSFCIILVLICGLIWLANVCVNKYTNIRSASTYGMNKEE